MLLGFSSDDAIRYFIDFREIPNMQEYCTTKLRLDIIILRGSNGLKTVILKEIQKIWRSGEHKERALGTRKSSIQVASTTLANRTRQTTKRADC